MISYDLGVFIWHPNDIQVVVTTIKAILMVGSENIYQTKNSPIILQLLWENKVTTAWFKCYKMLFMNCFKEPKMNNKLQKKQSEVTQV